MQIEKSWKKLLKEYEVPTFAKEKILKPLFIKQKYKEPVLDAGCGNGFFSNLLTKKGIKVISIDKNLNKKSLISPIRKKIEIEKFNPEKLSIGDILLINVLSCVNSKKRRLIIKNLQKIKSPDSRIFVINVSEEIIKKNFKSKYIQVKKLSKGVVHLINKKIDGTQIEFNDYLIKEDKFKEFCKKANLKIILEKKLQFLGEKFPIFNFYILE